jgi:hypothetical protein
MTPRFSNHRAFVEIVAALLFTLAFAQGAPHPALQPPDGQSHRGGKMVGDTLQKWGDVLALGKLYQGAEKFEARQEYLLRLLDYLLFSKDRLTGMKRAEIEAVFGKGKSNPVENEKNPNKTRYAWSGGRDCVLVWFDGDVATGADYVMGY